MKIFEYMFDGRSTGARISVGVSDDGETLIYLPGCPEAFTIRNGHPVEIDISGNGPGPDVRIHLEVKAL